MGIWTLIVFAASNITCFLIGAKVGQKTAKGEELRMPDVNPMEAVRERRERHEVRMEQSRLDTILRNIDNYDGTERGQVDVPGR